MRASAPITVLQRLVRHFDFEEAERSPVPMPTHFYRVGQEQSETAQGFPLFGQMGPRRDLAYTGRWSFGFELAGGSMAARIPTGVLPVMPGSDYRAAVKVRTSGLHHARARLIAWLHDRSGAAIEASRVTSPPLVSEDHWETLAVDVPGDFPSATGLIVELQLAQPRLFRGASLAENEPVSEDYAGRVWFDDLKVWLLPRLEMSSGAPGNVFVDPDPPTLFLLVNDLISERLLARLRVHDLDGHTVVDRRLELEHGERPLRIDLPALPFGWYRSSVELLEQEASVGHRTVDFAYVPAPEPRPATKHTSFGVELSSFSPIEERLVSILGVGSAVIPVGVISEAERDANSTPQERGHALDACLATGMELILEVDATAEQVVQRLGTAPRERVERRAGRSLAPGDAAALRAAHPALADRLDGGRACRCAAARQRIVH